MFRQQHSIHGYSRMRPQGAPSPTPTTYLILERVGAGIDGGKRTVRPDAEH
jgi:hypothetical protein